MEPKRLSGSGGAARLPEYYAEKLSDPNLGKFIFLFSRARTRPNETY